MAGSRITTYLALAASALTGIEPISPLPMAFSPGLNARRLALGGVRWRGEMACLRMGLYDEPLPSRGVNKGDNGGSGGDKDTEEGPAGPPPTLFAFNSDGTEQSSLLPPLRRRLDSGIGCYFEPTDRQVRLLVEKTGCNPSDAAWALEAHGGRMTDAWVSISSAVKSKLNERVALPRQAEVKDVDWDLEFQRYVEQRESARPMDQDKIKDQKKKKKMREFFEKGNVDGKWLPGKGNPKPVDDEPWFTG